jgi:hypothetical protein
MILGILGLNPQLYSNWVTPPTVSTLNTRGLTNQPILRGVPNAISALKAHLVCADAGINYLLTENTSPSSNIIDLEATLHYGDIMINTVLLS